LETKNKAPSTLTNDVGSKARNNDMPIQAINKQRRKSKLTLSNEIDDLQAQVKELHQQLKKKVHTV
jgi:uncharacterized protein YlxW (UPF0749 family)